MIIGSLTTISSRIDTLYLVVKSLYEQTCKLNCLYLFISRDPYLLDEGIKTIPQNLKYYQVRFIF